MSKAHDPHWRYIALRLDGDKALSRKAMSNAIIGRGRKESVPEAELPRLTRYEWPHAIARVPHHQLQHARTWLPRIDFAVDGERLPIRVTTISASGTIKALTGRLGILEDRGEAKPKPPAGGRPAAPSRATDPRAAPPPGRRPPRADGPAPVPRRTPRRQD